VSGGGPPDRWLVLHLQVSRDPELRERVVDLLMGGLPGTERPRGVEEREDALVIYLPPPPEGGSDAVVEGVRTLVEGEGLVEAVREITAGWQPHEAWADHWRRGFGTRRITDRIVVTPSWEPVRPSPGEVVLVLDPGMAFGTSEHPTTRGCLRLLDGLVTPGTRIADVGSGSGILALAAAGLGAREVVAVELDPWAATAARENAERNGVADRVRVLSRGVGRGFLPGEGVFDGIVANIETPILRPLLPGFAQGVEEGGWLVLSGILESEAGEMTDRAREAGFRRTAVDAEEEWWSAAFVRVAGAPGGR
jgi:ribosomal protein L11 methyltransferase